MFDKFIAGLTAILFCSITLRAAEPVVHVSPKPLWLSVFKSYDKKPSLRTVEDGYFYALAEHQVQVEKQEDYHHFIREIVSETGIQNGSEISVSFDPTYERLDFHEITVWRNNKPQNRLSASAFKVLADEKDLSDFIYQGTYSALCILGDIRKGDRIEYSYTITGRNPIFKDSYCNTLYFQWYQTVAHQYTSLVFASNRNLNMRSFNGVSTPVITAAHGLTRYDWEDFQVAPAPYDETAPSWYDARACVQISSFKNWQEVTDWALSINPVKTNIKGELAAQIAKLKVAAANDKEKYFRAAVKTVQDEVRYMGIEIGPYSHKANDPEKVFNQRYGDCKDKSLLLVSMLRADGIDANMVLLNSNYNGLIDQFIPSNHIFDHAVVVADVNGKQVWVDATIDDQGGSGTHLYFPAYGKGLVLKPGNTGLTTIPSPENGKISCEEKFIVKDERSPVRFDVKTVYTLNEADRVRDRLELAGMAETEKNYLKYYAKVFNKIEAKDSIVVIDNLQKNVLTTVERYEIKDFLKRDTVSGEYSADFYADYIKEELPTITALTKTPVAITYPFNEDYTIKVIMPFEWDIAAKHNELKRDAYRFSSDYSATGKTLSLNYQFAYLADFVPVDKLDEFKSDIKELSDNGLSYSISYRPFLSDPASDVNQWMLNVALFLVLILSILAVRIYRTETPAIVFSHGASFTPLGPWIILVVISLFVTPIGVVNVLIDDHHFSMSAWQHYGALKNGTALKAQMVFEVMGSVVIMYYSFFCLMLLINKRDILRKYIIGYFAFSAIFCTADYALVTVFTGEAASHVFAFSILRTIIIACIGIPYFLRSSLVEDTFIVPYPSYNYSYEARPEATEGVN